ncbi:hypothetical protein G7051_17525 [Dysgonomonas sp. HDW5B]|uniref:hypothetical protein n=1 Tax=Dysgonomonas sp. HDW5B TaxID=2714927 RepID=UPI00140DE44D|nr:hypothetical protein [Dysgonomonas sp. HDW5B]QIK56061.1 hypothetical protein G7051_17525 [Dysgonomonas sp. HDW5B]
MLENLQRLPVEIVERFLEVRDAKKVGISPALADYILELNEASNLHRKYRSVSECANKLRITYPHLSIPTCKSRIYDAINFFNSDCSVTSPAWNNYFADQMMKLADICLVAHDFGQVDRCWTKARNWRIEASANVIDPKLISFKPQIVSADITLKRMGVSSPKGILKAWEEAQTIIKSRDISQSEKDRLLDEVANELNIETVDYKDVNEDS